jgi:hypothetical protein
MTELEKYREVYNQFITLLTDLHNFNVGFSKSPTVRNGTALRAVIRKLRVVEKSLWDASQRSTKEAKANKAATLQSKREERAYNKANPKKLGRPKKEK